MLDTLRARAHDAAARSHVPYSQRPAGAAVLLADGRILQAPRLENASFPLTITAIQGAVALALHSGGEPVAVALHRDLEDADAAIVHQSFPGDWVADGSILTRGPLPHADLEAPSDLEAATALALEAADHAVVPASGFHVGALVEDDSGRCVMGANVEVEADWTRGLCAERVAVVRAAALGFGTIRRVTVACVPSPGGSPCGGCRQVLAELAPECEVVIWRGDQAPEVTTPHALLPGVFTAESLRG